MKKLLPLLALGLFAGCTSLVSTADRLERGLTPPDAVNYVTTKADGTFETQINDQRIAGKLALLGARKSKTPAGFAQVQFELRNDSLLGRTINVSFEWLSADGRVTETQPNWVVTPLEPGAIALVNATALKVESAECRLRFLSR
jgi:hypothetical protein